MKGQANDTIAGSVACLVTYDLPKPGSRFGARQNSECVFHRKNGLENRLWLTQVHSARQVLKQIFVQCECLGWVGSDNDRALRLLPTHPLYV